MKKIFFLIIFCIAAVSSFIQAQETVMETLTTDVAIGGFLGPAAKFGSIKGNFAFFLGARGGWVFDHRFIVGGAANFLTNKVKQNVMGERLFNHMNYGGAVFGYVLEPHSLFHMSLSSLIGGGLFGFHEDNGYNRVVDEDDFFVVEPEVNLELNVSYDFRIILGISYLLVNGVDLMGTEDKHLNKFAGNVVFVFGKF